MAKSRKRRSPSAPPVAVAPVAAPDAELLVPRLGRALAWLVPSGPLARRAFAASLVAVWALGVALRLVWLARVGWSTPEAQWHGVPLPISADGFFFGTGVDAALHGDSFGLARYESFDSAIVSLTWLVTKLLPISLASAMVYLPPLIAPLIAIPTALLARELLGARAAVLAALLAVVGPVYARRSLAGYFDTDMFAVTIPLVAVWLLVRLLRHGRARDGLIAALVLAALPFFYSQGGPVGAAIALAGAVALVLCARGADGFGSALAVLGLSQLPLHWALRAALLVPVWFALRRLPARADAGPARAAVLLRWLPVALALVGFGLSSEWSAALEKLRVFTGASGPLAGLGSGPGDLLFPDASTYVSEAQRPELAELAVDVAGSLPAFLLALVGCIALQLRFRAFLVATPLLGLGLFAAWGGTRFGIYAVPIAALGTAAVATALAQRVRRPAARTALGLALAAAAAVPAAARVAATNPYIPFLRDEIAPIEALAKLVKPGDVTLAAWDYGYPIGYYAHARTLADGGRHAEDAAAIDEILLGRSQRSAATLARWLAETSARPDAPEPVIRAVFAEAQSRLGLSPQAFLAALGGPDLAPPPATRDVYFYLPVRMGRSLTSMELLRPRPPGAPSPEPFARIDFDVRFHPLRMKLGDERVLDPNAAVIVDRDGRRPLAHLYFVQGFGDSLKILPQDGTPGAATTGIYLQASNVFLELDERLLNSVFVQLVAFQKADPSLFELVYANPVARIYRLRR